MSKSNVQRGKLFVISGPSGVGKGTIVRELVKDGDAELSISMTTRQPREGEINGKDYFFISAEAFRENIEKENFLEYATVYDNMYGTPRGAVMSWLEKGRDVLLEIDIQGGLQVKKSMPEAVMVFILPPSLKELRDRITRRDSDTEEVIDKRMSQALNEIKLIGEYDYYVVNDELQKAVSEVDGILIAERRKVPERVASIIRPYEDERDQRK